MHKKMIKILRIYHITNLGNSLLEPNISAYKQNSFCLHTPKCASHLDVQSCLLVDLNRTCLLPSYNYL
jgi:hypothetical protein